MPTATMNPPATAARFALVDAAGHAYRALTFATERAASLHPARQAPTFRRMLATAGYKVGRVGTGGGIHTVNTPAPAPRDCQAPASGSSTGAARPVDNHADVCRLVLTIRGVEYRVVGIPAEAFGATARAFRLRKVGSAETHHVAETAHGAECDCPDFIFRHDGRDALGCKHCRALRALGLIR